MAPLAVKVVLCPEQVVPDEAVTETAGVAVTFTVAVLVELQVPLEPVTVYTVRDVGQAEIEKLLTEPGIQV